MFHKNSKQKLLRLNWLMGIFWGLIFTQSNLFALGSSEADIYKLKPCVKEFCDCSNRSCAKDLECRLEQSLNGTMYICMKKHRKKPLIFRQIKVPHG